MPESADIDLWLLYVDWSATQINKRLLELSVDELWALANDPGAPDPADASPVPADLLPSQSSPVELLQLVRKATLSTASTPVVDSTRRACGRTKRLACAST